MLRFLDQAVYILSSSSSAAWQQFSCKFVRLLVWAAICKTTWNVVLIFMHCPDGLGSTVGGLLGTSALTTFVESASAVREGGRTGLTAVVCAVLFFLSVFFWPIFSSIPNIATGPVLVLIGVLIFMSAVNEIPWQNLPEAGPAFITLIVMPTTNNIAYGCIAGIIAYIISMFVTYQLFPIQQKWPGYARYSKWTQVSLALMQYILDMLLKMPLKWCMLHARSCRCGTIRCPFDNLSAF